MNVKFKRNFTFYWITEQIIKGNPNVTTFVRFWVNHFFYSNNKQMLAIWTYTDIHKKNLKHGTWAIRTFFTKNRPLGFLSNTIRVTLSTKKTKILICWLLIASFHMVLSYITRPWLYTHCCSGETFRYCM